jgi:tRNA (guanine26-N2/guanine27-N2)-dimethyltransferase
MPPQDLSLPKVDDVDTRSLISMQELDPSPVHEEFGDIESGDSFHEAQDAPAHGGLFPPKLGLRGHNWDSWCMLEEKRFGSFADQV